MQKDAVKALAAHDERRAFNSLLHDDAILNMPLAGVDPCILAPMAGLYENLKVKLRLPVLVHEWTNLLYDFAVSTLGLPTSLGKERGKTR